MRETVLAVRLHLNSIQLAQNADKWITSGSHALVMPLNLDRDETSERTGNNQRIQRMCGENEEERRDKATDETKQERRKDNNSDSDNAK